MHGLSVVIKACIARHTNVLLLLLVVDCFQRNYIHPVKRLLLPSSSLLSLSCCQSIGDCKLWAVAVKPALLCWSLLLGALVSTAGLSLSVVPLHGVAVTQVAANAANVVIFHTTG